MTRIRKRYFYIFLPADVTEPSVYLGATIKAVFVFSLPLAGHGIFSKNKYKNTSK